MTILGRKHFLFGCSGWLFGQQFPDKVDDKEKPKRLPDGTLQSEAILKDEQKKMLADAAKLIELGNEIETEIKKHDHHVLSVGLLKKLEEVEKLARRMRGRHNR
jgi:hypothetical protein